MAVPPAAILQFSFFVVFALLGTVLSMRLRQPYVAGLLVFGMLAGPNVLGLVSDRELISMCSELGSILLLFTVGIEFSVSRIFRSGFRAVFITLFKMGLLFAFGYEIGLHAGLGQTVSLFTGAMVSITSTAIMYKIVSQKGMARNALMPLLFSMLIVEDVVAVAALTFFSALALGPSLPVSENTFVSVFISLGFLGAFYVLARKPLAGALSRLTQPFNTEVTIFASFTLCLCLAMLAQFFGLSPAIGAFLAGSIVASVPHSRSIEKSIRPLLLMFASLFFLSLGMSIDPSAVVQNLPLALALVAAFMLVCFVSVVWLLYSTGASAKNSLFGASSMVVLGEFSLIIASTAPGADGQLLVAVGSFGVVASAVVSSLLLDRQQQLLELGQRFIPPGIKSSAASLSGYFSGLVRDFSPHGSFWNVSNVCWQCIRSKIGRIAAIALLVVACRFAIPFFGLAQGPPAAGLRGSILLLGLIPIGYYVFGILRDLRPVLDALSRTIVRHKKNARAESVILRDLAIVAALIFLSVAMDEVVSYLGLPSEFGLAGGASFLLALVFIWDVMRHAAEIHRQRRAARRE